jgi:hypothetical protein
MIVTQLEAQIKQGEVPGSGFLVLGSIAAARRTRNLEPGTQNPEPRTPIIDCDARL